MIEATSYVVNSPQGKEFIPQVVPLLLKYLQLFPQLQFEETDKQIKRDAGFFFSFPIF